MAEKNATKFDYLELLKSTQNEIDEKYEKVIQSIQNRKLCSQILISDLKTEYNNLEKVRDDQLAKLDAVKSIYEDSPGDNRANGVQEQVLKGIQEHCDQLYAISHARDVRFVWDSNLEKSIEKLGWLEIDGKRYSELDEKVDEQLYPVPNPAPKAEPEKNDPGPSAYGLMKFPKVESYSPGSEYDQLNNPGGVAISQDDTFFVADHNNNRVSAYTHWGKLTFSFQHPGFMGMVNRMQGPWGLCCYDGHVYLTESRMGSQHAALKMFTLKGTCTAEIAKYGTNNGEFVDPTGLDFDEEAKELYVCDRGNNRVQIFSAQLKFLRMFVTKMIHQPRDVKIGDKFVFILDENDPCMHMFHKETGRISVHVHLKGSVKPVSNPWFFALDKAGNMLISDRDNDLIQIFSQGGQMLHALGNSGTVSFVKPTGIAVNMSGNIVVACIKESGCLQIL